MAYTPKEAKRLFGIYKRELRKIWSGNLFRIMEQAEKYAQTIKNS